MNTEALDFPRLDNFGREGLFFERSEINNNRDQNYPTERNMGPVSPVNTQFFPWEMTSNLQ